MKTAPKASWWQRVWATLLDGLLLSVVGLIVGVALAAAAGGSSDDATVAVYVAVFFASVLYAPLLMARHGDRNGQTIGKGALGIRVVHEDGHPMTFKRGLLRDGLGKALLGIIPLYTFVDVLWPLPDADNQALHDKVGSTYVVDAHQVPVFTYRSEQTDGFTPPSASLPPSAPPPAPPPPPPPPPPPVVPAPAPQAEPDLGGFSPPAAPPSPTEDEDARGPFGPSYD